MGSNVTTNSGTTVANNDTDIDSDNEIDTANNETNNETNNANEVVTLPQALQNYSSTFENINPTTLMANNVRPINRDHALDLQEKIRAQGGLNNRVIVVRRTTDDEGNTLSTPENWIFDGHHRHTAIVGSEQLHITGLIGENFDPETDDVNWGEFFATIPCEVYPWEAFGTELAFYEAQLLANKDRRNIDNSNAADQAASVFQLFQAGATPADIMAVTEKSRAWVSLMLRAHENAVAELKQAVREGLIAGKTMIEGAALKKSEQKKMLRQILRDTKDQPAKTASKIERSITEEYKSANKDENGNAEGGAESTPTFPKSINRKTFGATVFEKFSEVESDVRTAGGDIKAFIPKGERENALVSKGFIQGLLYAFGVDKADEVGYTPRQIAGAFKKLTGAKITDITPWEGSPRG